MNGKRAPGFWIGSTCHVGNGGKRLPANRAGGSSMRNSSIARWTCIGSIGGWTVIHGMEYNDITEWIACRVI